QDRADRQEGSYDKAARRGWGNVARRGAGVLSEPSDRSAAGQWRAAVARAREEDWEPEVWVEEAQEEDAEPRKRAGQHQRPGPPRRGRTGDAGWTASPSPSRSPSASATPSPQSRPRQRIPRGVAEELSAAVGAKRAASVVERLADANRAYERDRFQDARRILKPLAEEAPQVAAVRHLLGLTSYQMGRWREAIRELEAH